MGQGCESCCTNKDAEGELNYGNNQYANKAMNGQYGNNGQAYGNNRLGSQAKANSLRESKNGINGLI